MPQLAAHPRAFIRPSPSSGSLGGVARATREALLLCEAAGHEVIFVETVGVGQSETTVHGLVDFFLLLMLAGAGDELQGLKRGIMEMADALLITKADQGNEAAARRAQGEYRNALHLFPHPPSGWSPPVLLTSAVTGKGVADVWEMIEKYTRQTQQNGFFQQRRQQQQLQWLHHTIAQELEARFYANAAVQSQLPAIQQAVAEGRQTPFTAAQTLLGLG
jgi:LAO/AO transport system kinase